MRLPRRPNLIAALLFLLSGVILAWTVYTNLNIDVIDDKSWRLILPAGDIYAGQTIYVKSEYTKLRQVEGQSTRYVECWTRDNIQVAYLVSTAVANRAKGTGGTGLPIPIPANIPDLPARCDIRVVVKYHVLPLRDVIEVKTSKDFTLQRADASGGSSAATGTSQPQSQPLFQSQTTFSSSNNALPLIEPQLNTSQPQQPAAQPSPAPTATPATPSGQIVQPANPTLLQRLQTAVRGIPVVGRLVP